MYRVSHREMSWRAESSHHALREEPWSRPLDHLAALASISRRAFLSLFRRPSLQQSDVSAVCHS